MQNAKNIFFVAFIQKNRQVSACRFFYPALRADDIPQQVANDIHAFGVMRTRNAVRIRRSEIDKLACQAEGARILAKDEYHSTALVYFLMSFNPKI